MVEPLQPGDRAESCIGSCPATRERDRGRRHTAGNLRAGAIPACRIAVLLSYANNRVDRSHGDLAQVSLAC